MIFNAFPTGNRKIKLISSCILIVIMLVAIFQPVSAAEINGACSVSQGFHFQSNDQSPVGFIEYLNIAGEEIAADFVVKDPTNVSSTMNVVGVMSGTSWPGGYSDPINFICQVSDTNKTKLSILAPLLLQTSTPVEFIFSVYEFDPIAKVYYKSFHSDSIRLKGLVMKTGGESQLSIDTSPGWEVSNPVNYTLILGIIPQAISQKMSVSAAYNMSFVQAWGVEIGDSPPIPTPHVVATSFPNTLVPVCGADNEITLKVRNSEGSFDTDFSGAHNVTISGYQQASDGTYGSFNGTVFTASPNTVSVDFTNGVATANLKLNKAAAQTIGFSIAGVDTPATNNLTISPVPAGAASMTVTQDITAPTANGSQFAQQPKITLKDTYGNTCTNNSSTIVTASKKDAEDWTLTGTRTATASSGIVTFTNLGATNAVLVDNAQLAFNTAGLPEVASTAVTLPAPAPTPTVPIVTSVTVTPAVISVRKGNTQSFSATVAGTNSPSQTVTWSVYGDTSANTVIDINGLLTVAADETVNTLTVKATSTVDSTKSGTATVTVKAPLPTYTVTFKDWDEIVLKTQTVDEGGAATAPSNPTRVGYAFTSWDNAFNNVTSNLTVTAQYIKNRYTVTPAVDVSYTAGTTSDGITTMTVKNGVTGFKYFTVNISVEQSHSGNETVVFVHLRNGEQLAINATRADFDVVNTAAAAFNVNPGDIIKVYIVDDLSNDSSLNPTLLQ